MFDWLRGKKTYFVSGLMALTALSHLVTGEITFLQFVTGEHVTTLLEAIGLGTLRAGIAKRLS